MTRQAPPILPEPSTAPTLRCNLDALRVTNAALARRLTLPADTSHLRVGEGGALFYRLRQRQIPLELPPAALSCILPNFQDASEIILFGCGIGTLTHAALDRWPEAHITLWDRDPALLRIALSRVDLSEAIAEGRLTLLLGADLKQVVPLPDGARLVCHPLARALYGLELEILETGGAGEPVALSLGGLFVDDVADALRAEGYCPWPIAFKGWDVEESAHALEVLAPRFALSINYVHGLPAFLEAQGIPLIVWEIDPTTEASPALPSPPPWTRVFTYRAQNVAPYKNGGFPECAYLPLAANPARRAPLTLSPEEGARYGCEVSFVGSSMVGVARQHRRRFVEAYLAWHPEGEAARPQCEAMVQAVLGTQQRAGRTFVLAELMEELFEDFLADARLRYAPEDPTLWLAEVAAAQRRLTVACRLGSLGIHLWGDPGWRGLTTQGAHYRGFAGHGAELSRIYCASQINVDMGRLYQPDIVTMRVFDVLACGGFIIAERSPALGELFALGEEIESYESPKELLQKIQHYRAHPDEARALAERGRRAVLERHTIRQRIASMVAALPTVAEA